MQLNEKMLIVIWGTGLTLIFSPKLPTKWDEIIVDHPTLTNAFMMDQILNLCDWSSNNFV
jgi:hypothetical protein